MSPRGFAVPIVAPEHFVVATRDTGYRSLAAAVSELAECSNRIILRVNETSSLRTLEEMYGGSRGRYNGALNFNPGEALVEGALLCDELPPPTVPRGIAFERANTKEGGGTPNTDWARPAID